MRVANTTLLTVLVLSCRRTHLLRRSVSALKEHFRAIEPEVAVKWVCFDNGSSRAEQAELLDMGFDLILLSDKNLGQGPAINHLISSLRSPYYLLLEDDWEVHNAKGLRFVSESIRFMDTHPRVSSVKLDACHFLEFEDRKVYDGPFRVSEVGPAFYVQNPQMLWGGFCFPPSVTKSDSMRDIGPCTEEQPFRRGWAESYCSTKFSRKYLVAKSPEMLLFNHIGAEPSSGWADTQ